MSNDIPNANPCPPCVKCGTRDRYQRPDGSWRDCKVCAKKRGSSEPVKEKLRVKYATDEEYSGKKKALSRVRRADPVLKEERRMMNRAKPCAKCGGTEKTDHGRCVACEAERKAARFAARLLKPCVKCGVVDRNQKTGACLPCGRASCNARYATPEEHARRAAIRATPEWKERNRAFYSTPEQRAKARAWFIIWIARPEVRERQFRIQRSRRYETKYGLTLEDVEAMYE